MLVLARSSSTSAGRQAFMRTGSGKQPSLKSPTVKGHDSLNAIQTNAMPCIDELIPSGQTAGNCKTLNHKTACEIQDIVMKVFKTIVLTLKCLHPRQYVTQQFETRILPR